MVKNVPIKDLKIGDVVKHSDYETSFDSMTVINKTDEIVKFFRPYVSLADFTYTGGVIPYIGIEQFEAPLNGPSTYDVLDNIYREKSI